VFKTLSRLYLGCHPRSLLALELSKALDIAPTGIVMSNFTSDGFHFKILNIFSATSAILYLCSVPIPILYLLLGVIVSFSCIRRSE
jgi:hypothetical protein